MKLQYQFTIKKVIIILFATGVMVFYYLINPASYNVGPDCLLKTHTGWQCWGCGGQRAFHELLHGNFEKAFQLNMLIFPVLPLFGYIIFEEIFAKNPSYPLIRTRRVSFSLLILFTAFTILRNL